MSVPTRPPPYVKPGFGLIHVAQRAALNGAVGMVTSSPFSPPDPNSRGYDGLHGPVVRKSAPTVAGSGWTLNRAAEKQPRVPINLVGWLGNNWYRNRATFRLDAAAPDLTAALRYLGTTDEIREIGMPGNAHWVRCTDTTHGDGDWQNTQAPAFLAGTNTEPLAIGEYFATKIQEPVDGIAASWVWSEDANLVESTTQAGAVYTTQRGEARRRFTLRQDRIPSVDMGFWKEVYGVIGRGQPFVYVPPEFGQWKVPRIVTDSAADWSGFPSGDVSVIQPGHDGAADAVRLTSTAAGNTSLLSEAPTRVNGPENWRGKWLAFDVRMSTWAWLTAPLEFVVRVWSNVSFAVGDQSTTYDLSEWFRTTSPEANEWYRIFVDLEGHPQDDVSTQSAYHADLGAIDRVQIAYTPTAGGQLMDVCNVDLVDPLRAPALINGDGAAPQQDSPNPLQDPTYGVRLEFVESLA